MNIDLKKLRNKICDMAFNGKGIPVVIDGITVYVGITDTTKMTLNSVEVKDGI